MQNGVAKHKNAAVSFFLLYNLLRVSLCCRRTLFFFIRTSNFDAEAERSYIFWRFEAETFLKMFLNLPGIGTTDTRFLKKT